ncbi:MAG: hypothetical protein ABR555_05220 [Pyrinomonadaceae bacterium]
MIRFLSFMLGVFLLSVFGVIGQKGDRIGEFKLKDGRTIKASFDDKLLIVKTDSDAKGTPYWIVSSNSLTSVARESGDQAKPEETPRFILKNETSHLIFAQISTAMLERPGAESAILTKLQWDYVNSPPTEGVYLTFVAIDGKQQMVPANSFRGSLEETTTVQFLNSSIKLRGTDGKTITIPMTQLVSYTR